METIEAIIREMRDEVRTSRENNSDPRTRIFLSTSNMAIEDFAERIEKAFAAYAKINEQQDMDNNQLQAENKRLRAENKKLLATLKPILEVEWHKDRNGPNGYTVYGVPLPSLAVKAAQKIYKEATE